MLGAGTASTRGRHALANLEALIHAVELGEIIGEGGMGVVRGGEQLALGRQVAVKALRADKRSTGAALDLLREAWLTGALEHPNIVPVHALEVDDKGMPSIVMKRIGGVEWSQLLGDAPEVARRFGAKDLLAWNLGILMHVLDAVRFAHSHGILHRDLKPANVMIGDFGEVYLLDWGIAVSLRDDGSGRFPLASHVTQIAGTPHYMAPEMLLDGTTPLSERTDVYLAGAVLYHLIAGKPPHAGKNALAVFASVIASRPELPASAPPELARICLRALQEDPAERFDSIDGLRRALQDYLEHRGSEQIAVRAHRRLAELRERLAAPIAESDRDDIYRLFGACRHGFHDALAGWPANEPAARGLVEAVVDVATYELASGRPQAAVSLLGELADPPALLEQARAAAASERDRVAELERLGRFHDKNIGTRTRTFLTLVLGALFTIIPITIELVPAFRASSNAMHAGFAFAMVVALVGAAWWARESMTATAINRRLIGAILFMFLTQGVMAVGNAIADRPAPQLLTWNLVLYAAIAGMLTLSIDTWLWPAVVAYLVGFLLASYDAALVAWVTAGANALITVIAVSRWRPATLRYSEEERAAMLPRGTQKP